MKINKIHALLLVIFLTGAALRVWPAAAFDKPLRFDSYYHVRAADLIRQTGAIPGWEPWPYGGRPHIYPPLYHVLIAASGAALNLSSLDVVRFLLPVISSLTVLAAFWVTRRLEDEKTALLAAFFIALNPSLIATSYDSPQIIGLFLSCFCVYWCLRQRYLAAGGVLAVIYLFNTFSALCISLPLAAFLVLERRWRQIPRLFAAPAVACAAWYLSRYDALYCYNSTLGPELISRVVGRWIEAYTPTILLFFVAATALVGNLRERFDRLWFVWLSAFTSLYLLNFVTPAFHPWRLDTFFFFGMSFLFASIFRKLDLRRLFFFVFFAVAGLSILYGLFTQDVFGPPFNPNEYALIERLGAMPAGMIPIANHDFCSNILALTNKTCLLDINFECIPNASRWYDYEQFFWVSRPGEMAGLLSRYPMTHVVYSSGDWGRTLLDKIEVNKIYSSWQCGIDCSRDANIYEVLRHNGSVRVLS